MNTGVDERIREAADHILTTTRAVRRRLDLERPVPDEVIADCIRIALQAPMGGNMHSWRFVVVTDPALRASLAYIYRAPSSIIDERAAAIPDDDHQTQRVYASAAHLVGILDRVPVHVLPFVRSDDFAGAPPASMFGSVIQAAWSFMLAARARGLGTAWTTLTVRREAEVRALLGVPDNMTHVALLPLAYLQSGVKLRPAARPEPDAVTHWNGWGGRA